MRKQFDIKYRPQIESGEYKVVVRNDTPVHILSFEALGPLPICYQVGDGMDTDFEVYFANEKGECSYPPCSLFIVTPEQELSEFEKAIRDLVLAIDEGELQELGVFEEENLGAWAIKKAAELLALAEREIVNRVAKECYKEDFCIEDTVKFNEGYKLGKEVILKDLPRWEKQGYAPQEANIYLPTNELVYHGMAISIDDLTKLPGFKED